jgi:hypothetical protein
MRAAGRRVCRSTVGCSLTDCSRWDRPELRPELAADSFVPRKGVNGRRRGDDPNVTGQGSRRSDGTAVHHFREARQSRAPRFLTGRPLPPMGPPLPFPRFLTQDVSSLANWRGRCWRKAVGPRPRLGPSRSCTDAGAPTCGQTETPAPAARRVAAVWIGGRAATSPVVEELSKETLLALLQMYEAALDELERMNDQSVAGLIPPNGEAPRRGYLSPRRRPRAAPLRSS